MLADCDSGHFEHAHGGGEERTDGTYSHEQQPTWKFVQQRDSHWMQSTDSGKLTQSESHTRVLPDQAQQYFPYDLSLPEPRLDPDEMQDQYASMPLRFEQERASCETTSQY